MGIFKEAKAVFIPGMEAKPNTLAAFRTDFKTQAAQKTELILAARTFYRVYLNGELLGTGPAPAPFGQMKADRYDLTGRVLEHNKLAVEVMGYVPEENSYATHENSCLIAEVCTGSEVAAATGSAGWTCGVLAYKDNNMESLSFGRRVPLEAYNLEENYSGWRTGGIPGGGTCPALVQESIITERGVAMPDTTVIDRMRLLGLYNMLPGTPSGNARSWWESDAYTDRCGGADIKRPGYECSLLTEDAYDGKIVEEEAEDVKRIYQLSEYVQPAGMEFAMGRPETGMLGISFETAVPCVVDIIWCDFLDDRGRLPVRADSLNRVIRLNVSKGSYHFESMEPHFIKYIKVIVRGGETFSLKDLYVRTYRFPDRQAAEFLSSDAELNRIYENARTTLITNSLAFFLDSPERERGGWAGDSYWTGRAAAMLISDTTLERSMLYDFLAAEYTPMLEGSFPACCSGGQKNDPVMMYTWNLFLLLELTDYYQRTKDEKMIESYRERVQIFMEASQGMKNELGILENINGSVFVDWSYANEEQYLKPVSTAANALYALTADRLGKMYHRQDYRSEAAHIRQVFKDEYQKIKDTRDQPFTMYPYMADSMTVVNGVLHGNGLYSEAAQNYYLWTGLLSKEDAPDLYRMLAESFGPMPENYRGTAHLKIGNSGVFFGHMMRFEVLARYGDTRLLEKEMKRLCGYMSDKEPGTFWETLSGKDSRNHGFGSHYGVILMRDFLGMGIPDKVEKTVRFAPRPGSLKWAKGSIHTADGRVSASWNKEEEGFTFWMSGPKGYKIEAEIPNEYCYFKEMIVDGIRRPFTQRFSAEGTVSVRLDASCPERQIIRRNV